MNVGKLCHRYIRQSTFFIIGLSLLGLLVMQLSMLDEILYPILYSVIFSFVVEVVDALIWRRVALRAPESLPTFFIGVSGFRMLAALAFMFIYYLATDSDNMLAFLLVFMIYYFVLMTHHTIFFSKVMRG